MPSMLETLAVWLMLAFYWLNIKLPCALLLLGMDLVRVACQHVQRTWRELLVEIDTTREIADL